MAERRGPWMRYLEGRDEELAYTAGRERLGLLRKL